MKKKLVLYGAGECGLQWLNRIGEKAVWKFADSDSDKAKKKFGDKEVLNISQLNDYKDSIEIFISVSENYQEEIRETLRLAGMNTCIVESPYLFSTVRMGKNSRLNIGSTFEGENYIGDGSRIENSYMGYASYISNSTTLQNVKIGRYCAISEGVSVIRGQHPTKQFVSIHPAFYSPGNSASSICYVSEELYKEFNYVESGYVVDIGNDVWIGKNVQLMEGITIGNGAVIAAGAVVTKDVQPYAIVGGIPAKLIRDRFSEDEKVFLDKLQWWNKSEEWIKENAKYFSNITILQKMENNISG